MKKYLYGRIISIVMIAALCFSFLPHFTVEAEEQGNTAGQLNVADYKKGSEDPSQWEPPKADGKVFAGWYEDAEFTKPYKGTTGKAYAKFVDAKVLSVKKQLQVNTTLSSLETKIRFLTSIDDCLDYRCVGFQVRVKNPDKYYHWQETTAYTSVVVEGKPVAEKAGVVFENDHSAHFVVHTLTGIPKEAFDSPFSTRAYWITADGTTVYGTPSQFTIRDTLNDINYDNGVYIKQYEGSTTVYENDYSVDVNKGVDVNWKKSAFQDSTAVVESGQARITSTNHVFVFGRHTGGMFGGVGFEKNAWYKVSFDLKLGSKEAGNNKKFTLYVMKEVENADPRFGDIQKTLTLDFSDINNFVTANTDKFAHVSYDAATETAHIDAVFLTDANVYTQLVSKSQGTNNWLLDNMVIKKLGTAIEEEDYNSGDKWWSRTYQEDAAAAVYQNDYSVTLDYGLDRVWNYSAFNKLKENSAKRESGKARMVSTASEDTPKGDPSRDPSMFVFGTHEWGAYGGVKLEKDRAYKVSFDLTLGDPETNREFNLYVMKQVKDPGGAYGYKDPRYGEEIKKLTLNFANFQNFATEGINDFAHVTYTAETHVAHIEAVFQTDSTEWTQLVAKSGDATSYNWLLDNMKITEMLKNYEEGEDLTQKYNEVGEPIYFNDYSSQIEIGDTQEEYYRSPFKDSEPELLLSDGRLKITSNQHVFVFGEHFWAKYGGVTFKNGGLYKASFDLKLGSKDANKMFTLYVMKEKMKDDGKYEDPRFGDVLSTLTLDFSDVTHFVKTRTGWKDTHVTYTLNGEIAHVEVVFQADANVNTQLVSRNVGNNNWLLDNMTIVNVSEASTPETPEPTDQPETTGSTGLTETTP